MPPRAASSGRSDGASITARGWGWRYAGRRAFAIHGLDLEIQHGERVLLLGASGAGKSTLLQALAGVLGGDDEGAEIGELLIGSQPARDARGRVGLLLQDPDAQVILARVGDDVAFGCENIGIPREEIWRRVAWALEAVGLRVPLSASTATLSGGQKQRLALAGILAMRPEVILLDEPTANLDPHGVREVREAVERVAGLTGATLIVIEHRVALWQDLVDRVVVLEPAAGLLADGEPAAVLAAEADRLSEAGVWVPGRNPGRLAVERAGGAPLLRADALALGRPGSGIVADELDFALAEGTSTAVTGPNGAGKTTLALTLGGLLAPAAGAVVATDLLRSGTRAEPIRWRSKELLTRIGTVFQDPEHQFLAGTVREELAIGPHALKLPAGVVRERVDELLARLRLERLAGANPFTLSGGEKRRLSVATALATSPRVVILDEPTFGQDAQTWLELGRLLAELVSDGTALLAVTHDRDYVSSLADREIVLAGDRATVAT